MKSTEYLNTLDISELPHVYTTALRLYHQKKREQMVMVWTVEKGTRNTIAYFHENSYIDAVQFLVSEAHKQHSKEQSSVDDKSLAISYEFIEKETYNEWIKSGCIKGEAV